MAIEVRIPKEITEYREKILFGMSIRQLVCFIVAIVLSVCTSLLFTKVLKLSLDLASYIVILEAMPIMAVGFIRKNGFTFEKYAALFIRHKLGQQIRPYKTELLTEDIESKDITNKKGGKYAWIFEKGSAGDGTENAGTRDKKSNEEIRESTIFTVTKESRKTKRKAALREIKAAQQEYSAAKRRTKKAAKKASTPENSTADN